MSLKVSSSTRPPGHSWGGERAPGEPRLHQNPPRGPGGVGGAGARVPPDTHVLEAAVEGLQLLLGELGLRQQLLQPLGLVPYGRELQLGVAAVCRQRPPWLQQPFRVIPRLIRAVSNPDPTLLKTKPLDPVTEPKFSSCREENRGAPGFTSRGRSRPTRRVSPGAAGPVPASGSTFPGRGISRSRLSP